MPAGQPIQLASKVVASTDVETNPDVSVSNRAAGQVFKKSLKHVVCLRVYTINYNVGLNVDIL